MYPDSQDNVTESFSAELLLLFNETQGTSITTEKDLSHDITNTSLIWSQWYPFSLDTLDWSQVLVWTLSNQPQCQKWQPLHNIYFQIGHLALMLTTLIPLGNLGHFSGLSRLLLLRCGLLVYSVMISMWSLMVSCNLDTLVWSLVITCINTIWCLHSLYVIYTSKCLTIPKEMRTAYDSLFAPLGVDTRQFKKLLSCTKEIREVQAKETVITEKISRVDCLSLVLSGRLVVSQGGKVLHLVNKNQFLDSPEWFGVTTDEYFQVTVTALVDSTIITWHRDKIKFCLMGDVRLQAIFDHVVGRDVVRKLMQVNNLAEELQMNFDRAKDHPDIGGDTTSDASVEDKEDFDDKKPMITKEVTKDKSLLGSLIGGEIPSWRLVNIKETEDETIV